MGTSLPATSLRDGRQAPTASHPVVVPGVIALLARRGVARALDAFTVLFVTLAAVLLALGPVMRWASARIAPEPWGRALAATLLYASIAAVYEVTFLALRGQTPGKDVCKLKVVVVGTDSSPSWRRALVRTLPLVAARLVPGVLAGSLAALPLGATIATGTRRAAHDLLAGTDVVAYDDIGGAEAAAQVPEVDRTDLAEVYGPRSLRDLVARRLAGGR